MLRVPSRRERHHGQPPPLWRLRASYAIAPQLAHNCRKRVRFQNTSNSGGNRRFFLVQGSGASSSACRGGPDIFFRSRKRRHPTLWSEAGIAILRNSPEKMLSSPDPKRRSDNPSPANARTVAAEWEILAFLQQTSSLTSMPAQSPISSRNSVPPELLQPCLPADPTTIGTFDMPEKRVRKRLSSSSNIDRHQRSRTSFHGWKARAISSLPAPLSPVISTAGSSGLSIPQIADRPHPLLIPHMCSNAPGCRVFNRGTPVSS